MKLIRTVIRTMVVFQFLVLSFDILNDSKPYVSDFVSAYNQIHFHIKLITGASFPYFTQILQSYPQEFLAGIAGLGVALSFFTILNQDIGTISLLVFSILKSTPKFYHVQSLTQKCFDLIPELLIMAALLLILSSDNHRTHDHEVQKTNKTRL